MASSPPPRRRASAALLIVAAPLAVTACIGANALPGASASPILARPAPPASAAAPSPGNASPCAGCFPQPPNTTWTVDVGGKPRSFVVHVPPAYDASRPTPLVLNFHGYRMSPKLEEWLTSMTGKADAAGFLLVYPEGTGSPLSFDAGGCCGDAAKEKVDDVGFTRAMLDRLEADLCVDPRRIYATGMSNGGFMSHRLACELSDRIAAVAPVAGVNVAAPCSPARAVPVLDLHGTDDPTVPYGGNPKENWPSVEATIHAWVERDGCTGPAVEILKRDDVTCVSHPRCRDGAEVELCTIRDGGHTWPGGKTIPFFLGQGHTTRTIVANDWIWDFFERHPMGGRPMGGQ